MAITKNTADLLAQAASTLPDNTTQQISPQDEREMAENIAQSSYNKISDSALVGLKEYSTIPTYESGQGCISSNKIYISNKITGPGAFVPADWDLYAGLSAADKAKLDFITVTSGADLDQMQTDIAALDGARINKGTFDQALGVFPGGGTAQDGWTWIATGVTTTIDGVEINPDDAIVAITDNASTTVFAANWHLQDNTDKVLSVNSQSGNVVLSKTDIGLSNVPNTDATDRANHTGTQVVATISDFDSEVASNTAVAANTAKVSNATHTSEVTGSTALTIDKIAISNKTLVTADGLDHLLIGDASDSDNLKKVLVSDFLGGGSNIYTADGTLATGRQATVTDTLRFNFPSSDGTGLTFYEGTTELASILRSGTNSAAMIIGDHTGPNPTYLRSGNENSQFGGDGSVLIGNATAINRLVVKATGNAKGISVQGSTGWQLSRLTQGGATGALFHMGNASNPVGFANEFLQFYSDGSSWISNNAHNFGVGVKTPTAKLHVKGTGSTSGTTALLVQNSLGTDLLEVKDDGTILGNFPTGTEVGSGTDSLQQVGVNANASGTQSIALSRNSVASNFYSIAIGNNASAAGQGGVAISLNANAPTPFAISIGQNSDATSTNSIGIGNSAQGTGSNAVAIGASATASTLGSIAVGQSALANGANYSTCVGFQSKASAAYSSAFGTSMQVTAARSIMIGCAATPRINSVAKSLQVNFDEATSTVQLAQTADSWINTSANFGIGTNTPSAKLDVNGSTFLNGNLGVFGTTPIAQPTTAIIAPAPVAVGGVNVQTNDTFEGYTMSQVVKALRNLGVLA